MSRASRLVRLLQEIRLHEPPVTAEALAEAMQVSLRTLYRDIATLRESGARIDGEPGYGYTLEEDPALPPQVFSREEIEALVLGLREVEARGDEELALAARHALAKLNSTLPLRLQRYLKHAVLHAHRFNKPAKLSINPSLIRRAAWQELAIDIDYVDAKEQSSRRRVYPLSMVYLDKSLVMICYCCLRKATRVFRLDRLTAVEITEESFHPRRVNMLARALKEITQSSSVA